MTCNETATQKSFILYSHTLSIFPSSFVVSLDIITVMINVLQEII